MGIGFPNLKDSFWKPGLEKIVKYVQMYHRRLRKKMLNNLLNIALAIAISGGIIVAVAGVCAVAGMLERKNRIERWKRG